MKSTKKLIFDQFKNSSVMTLRFSAIITVFIVLIYAIAALILRAINFDNLSFLSIILVIFFVFLLISVIQPFIYSYVAMNIILSDPAVSDKVRVSGFFKTASIGFQPRIRKCLPIFSSLLFAILFYVISSFVTILLIYFICAIFSDPFKNLLTEFSNLYYSLTIDEAAIDAILNEMVALIEPYTVIAEAISSFVAVYVFFHLIGKNIFKYFFIPMGSFLPEPIFRSVFKNMLKSHKKEFNKDYYSIAWIFLIIYCVTFILTTVLLILKTTMPPLIISITSAIVSLIFIMPFLPLLFNKYQKMVLFYEKYFSYETNKKIEEEIKTLKDNYDKFSNEEKIQVDALIKNEQQILDKVNKAHFGDFSQFNKKKKNKEDDEK